MALRARLVILTREHLAERGRMYGHKLRQVSQWPEGVGYSYFPIPLDVICVALEMASKCTCTKKYFKFRRTVHPEINERKLRKGE